MAVAYLKSGKILNLNIDQENIMGRKIGANLSKAISIRVSEKELNELQTYCMEHDMSYSEYVRRLIITHLGLADDLITMSRAKIQ